MCSDRTRMCEVGDDDAEDDDDRTHDIDESGDIGGRQVDRSGYRGAGGGEVFS
jgi:hypothetical protein